MAKTVSYSHSFSSPGAQSPPLAVEGDIPTASIRMATVLMIRWLAIIGQTVTLLLVALYTGFSFPLTACFIAVALSALLNISLHFKQVQQGRNITLSEQKAAVHLGYDLVQLSVLLFLTGGLENPFALLMLAPATVSASLFSRRTTYFLAFIAVLLTTTLAFTPFDLPSPTLSPILGLLSNATSGKLIGLTFTILFLTAYIAHANRESRDRARALAVMRAALAREQQFAAIGGLAAAATHELGTPLSTILFTAKHQLDEPDLSDNSKDDLQLILSEVDRCRSILRTMTSGLAPHDPFEKQSIEAVLREAASPIEAPHIDLGFTSAGPQPPLMRRRPETIHAFRNIIDNAVRHAAKQVSIHIETGKDKVTVTVKDDGPGFSPAVHRQLGTPFVGRRRTSAHAPRQNPNSSGLGVGLFIADTLLSRTKGHIAFTNHTDGGAEVSVCWHTDDLKADTEAPDTPVHT